MSVCPPGADHLQTAESYERHRNGRLPVEIETLSTKPLEQLHVYNGETWLDRELTSENPVALGGGFGADVRTAMIQRQQWLVEQQLVQEQDGSLRFRANMLMHLRQRDFDRAVAQTEEETGRRHSPLRAGERVEGIYRKAVEVGDRRYGLIEKSREFSLVPWRPVLERAVGKQVSGIMREDGISWPIGGRSRGISL